MTYRNKAVLDFAKGHSCQLCGVDDGTTVAAHANSVSMGKGMGHKSHDLPAYVCCACHHEIDQGRSSRDVRRRMWWVAFKRSVPLYYHLLDEEGRETLIGMGYV